MGQNTNKTISQPIPAKVLYYSMYVQAREMSGRNTVSACKYSTDRGRIKEFSYMYITNCGQTALPITVLQ